MNKKITTAVAALILCFALVQCATQPKKESIDTGDWAPAMRRLAKNVEDLMPYVFSRAEFQNSANQSEIKSLLKDFVNNVQFLPQHAGEKILGDDPLIKHSIRQLTENSKSALKAFEEGHLDFAQRTLRSNSGVCFSCHTTQKLGPLSGISDATIGRNFKIRSSERASFYISTRQYDKATGLLEDILKHPEAILENPSEQFEALRKYLILQIRVYENPRRAIEVLNAYLSNKKVPEFISKDVEGWVESLKAWGKQDSKQDSVSQATALINKANKNQSSNDFSSEMVLYLRATKILHQALRTTKVPAQKAKIYELLGRSYDILPEAGFWELPEVYFEACVHTLPHSKMAEQCFAHYQRVMILGFSGSAGIFIPQEERSRMQELKELSVRK